MQSTHRAAVSEYAWACASWWMALLGGFPRLKKVLNLGAAQKLITQTIESFGGLIELYRSLFGAYRVDQNLGGYLNCLCGGRST